MKRRLLDLLSLLSLIFCAATVALWIRSDHGGQSLERVDPQRRIVITSFDGLIQIARWDGGFSPPSGTVFEFFHPPPRAWRRWAYWHGFIIMRSGPDDWAYQPSLGGYHWWQDMGFDWFDRTIVPVPNSFYIHDWLPPRWAGRERRISFPHWALVLVFLAMPALAFSRRVRPILRQRDGFCAECGYDLRGTPERCPECGSIAAASSVSIL